MEIKNNNIYFGIKLGSNLQNTLKTGEFKSNPTVFAKFEKLFCDKFENTTEPHTTLEMNKRGGFEFYNPAFPKIKQAFKFFSNQKTLPEKILEESPIAYGACEYKLFQKIISTEVKKGKSIDKIMQKAQTLLSDSERKECFFDLINTAKRILKENPNAKLTEIEFSEMTNRELKYALENADEELKNILAQVSRDLTTQQ